MRPVPELSTISLPTGAGALASKRRPGTTARANSNDIIYFMTILFLTQN